jgi:hypothetical protein
MDKKARKKLKATIAKQKATIGWGRGRKKKPYRKPGRISVAQPSARELVIRIALA